MVQMQEGASTFRQGRPGTSGGTMAALPPFIQFPEPCGQRPRAMGLTGKTALSDGRSGRRWWVSVRCRPLYWRRCKSVPRLGDQQQRSHGSARRWPGGRKDRRLREREERATWAGFDVFRHNLLSRAMLQPTDFHRQIAGKLAFQAFRHAWGQQPVDGAGDPSARCSGLRPPATSPPPRRAFLPAHRAAAAAPAHTHFCVQ